MKTKVYMMFLFVFAFMPFFAFADETLTITTYYPSPYGSYNQLTTASNTYLAYSSGSVGIGTTGPGAKLDVQGSTGSNVFVVRNSTDSASFGVVIKPRGTGYSGAEIQGTSYALGGTPDILLQPEGGNVGIGTASPGGRVSIYDSTPTQPPLLIDRGYDGARIHFAYGGADSTGAIGMTYFQPGKVDFWLGGNMKGTAASHTGPLQANASGPSWYSEFNTISDYFAINRIAAGGGSSTPFYINSSGNIGIDTTTINNRLQLSSGSNSTGMQFNISGYPSNWGSRIFNQDCYNGACNGVDLAIEVETSNTWYSAVSFGHGQDVNHPSLKAWYSAALATTSGNVSVGVNSTSYKFQVYIDGSNEGHVDSTGAWARSSDTRFKKNVSDLKDGLNKIMKLRAVRYDSKTDLKAKGPGKHLGFIGQEMEKVIPELVSTDNRGYKSIAYGDLTIVLTKAVQEQQKEIDDLKSEIQKLKAELHNKS